MSTRNFFTFCYELSLFFNDAFMFTFLDKLLRSERTYRRIYTSSGERSTVVPPRLYESVTGRLIIDEGSQIFAKYELKKRVDHTVSTIFFATLVSQPKNCLYPSPFPPPPCATDNLNSLRVMLDNFDSCVVAVLAISDNG